MVSMASMRNGEAEPNRRKSKVGGFRRNLCLGKTLSGNTRFGTRPHLSKNSERTSSLAVKEDRRLDATGEGGGARKSGDETPIFA